MRFSQLSAEMKRKTTYLRLDIVSLWQIRLALLECWLGMAGQKFMNSQCGEAGLEKADGEQFVYVCVPEGFINVWYFTAIRAGSEELTWTVTERKTKWMRGDGISEGRARKEQPVLVTLWYFGVQPWLRTSDWKDTLWHWRWMCQAFRGKQQTLCPSRQTCRAFPFRHTSSCEKLFDSAGIQIMVTFGEVRAQNLLVRFHQMKET